MTEEGNKETKKDKLLSVHKMLRPNNRVESGRINTCYNLRDNSVQFQAGDLVWLHNLRRRKSDWIGLYTVVGRINDCGLQDSTRTEEENEDCSLKPPHEVQQ